MNSLAIKHRHALAAPSPTMTERSRHPLDFYSLYVNSRIREAVLFPSINPPEWSAWI
jgi:hypothetical protein